jgi:hypothetical protein
MSSVGSAVGAGFATADAFLRGRVLYDEWAAYWPEHAGEPFGDVLDAMKKDVVSDSLQAAEWQNTEIISGDVAQELSELEAQDGGDLATSDPRRAEPPPRAPERGDLRDRRAEPQLRAGQELMPRVHSEGSSAR